jgi:hypothetical protein
MSPRFCTQCGNPLTDASQTCGRCGAPRRAGGSGLTPTYVGTFTARSRYSGRRILFQNQVFIIEGVGQVDPRHLPQMAAAGEIFWARPELEQWAREWADYTAASTAPAVVTQPQVVGPAYVVVAPRRHSAGGAIVMIIGGIFLVLLGVLFCLTLVGAIVGIPLSLLGGGLTGVGFFWLFT